MDKNKITWPPRRWTGRRWP